MAGNVYFIDGWYRPCYELTIVVDSKLSRAHSTLSVDGHSACLYGNRLSVSLIFGQFHIAPSSTPRLCLLSVDLVLPLHAVYDVLTGM